MPNEVNCNVESYDLDALPAINSKDKSWKSMQLKYLRVLAGVLGVCLIVVSVYTIVLSSHTKGNADTAPYECTTEDCVKTAMRMTSDMDVNVDPCVDFYKFACGNWTNNNPDPHWLGEWQALEKLNLKILNDFRELLESGTTPEGSPTTLVKAKELYKSCMDTDNLQKLGATPIRRMLASVGLPSEVPRVWSGVPWHEQIIRLSRTMGIKVLLNVEVEAITNDTNALQIYPKVYRDDTYISMVKVFDPEVDEQRFADDINSFIEKLSQIVSPKDRCSDYGSNKTFNVLEDKAFDGRIPDSPKKIFTPIEVECYNSDSAVIWPLSNMTEFWQDYLDLLYENTTTNLYSDDIVYISDFFYLTNLIPLLADTDPLIIEKYLFWSVFSAVAPKTYLNATNLDWSGKELRGEPRWKYCTDIVNEQFRYALSYLYVQSQLEESSWNGTEIWEDVRDAFLWRVEGLDWIDEYTHYQIYSKVEAMRTYVGHDDSMLSSEQIDEYYNTTEVIEGNFVETYFNCKKAEVKKNLESLQEPFDIDRSMTLMTTDVKNIALYYTPANSIIIAAANLQSPLSGNGLKAIDYGALGFLISHELTHAFDEQGHALNEYADASDWSESTEEKYQQKAQCLIDQYNQYNISDGDTHLLVNGLRTLSENIADNGGLRAAFDGFKLYTQRNPDSKRARLPNMADYEPNQLFFLGFAQTFCTTQTLSPYELFLANFGDTHSPKKVRVIGTLRNSQEFADAWKCPVGSPMNPEHKCVLW